MLSLSDTRKHRWNPSKQWKHLDTFGYIWIHESITHVFLNQVCCARSWFSQRINGICQIRGSPRTSELSQETGWLGAGRELAQPAGSPMAFHFVNLSDLWQLQLHMATYLGTRT